jgi:hypothetical protein
VLRKNAGRHPSSLTLATADASAAQSVQNLQPSHKRAFIHKTAAMHAAPRALYLWWFDDKVVFGSDISKSML